MSKVLFDIRDGVATVTLNRPEVLNAVDDETHHELHAIWDDIEARDDVRVVVLTGAGERAFCAGSDMKSQDQRTGVEYWAAGHPDGYGGLTVRRSLTVPVIGRIVRARNAAAVCEALAAAFAAGRPTPEAIASANLTSLNSVLRRRVTRWQQDIDAGRPLGQSAREARIPPLLADLLSGAQLDLSGAAAFAGRAYAATSERQMLVLRAAAPLLVTAFFAVGVAFIALAVFQPMALLIDTVATKVYP